jgi:peptidyl-dipeptidase Dcp
MTTPNPLLENWQTPYGLPPFDLVRAEDFSTAFGVALQSHRAEVDALAGSMFVPTFENTLVAFDRSGRLLARVRELFFNLTAAETSPALQKVELEIAPKLSAHNSAIYMNDALFGRIDLLHARMGSLGITPEAQRLLDRVHLDFVRAGAKLAPASKARYADVMAKLAQLTTQFSQNVLADESSFQLLLRDERDLAGLPESLRNAAKEAAVARGVNDAYAITLVAFANRCRS